MSDPTKKPENPTKKPRTLSGRVVSDRMDKTISVEITRRVKHPIYGKYVLKTTRVHAHDEHNHCKSGDRVTVAEHRPLSKTKSWMLLSIDERATQA
ncbi:MAG: 30S ribosomal protein S17 [Cellvibrionales bacterium]|nr:30S ribosomal protein S17 [Cellvibrionales bacterium]